MPATGPAAWRAPQPQAWPLLNYYTATLPVLPLQGALHTVHPGATRSSCDVLRASPAQPC